MTLWSYPKTLRLQNRSAFKAVFDHVDKRFFIKGLLVLVKKNNQLNPRLGVVISKKSLALAHQRNTIKRLLRESFRLNQQLLSGLDIVVVSRKELKEVDKSILREALNPLWRTINMQCRKP